MNHFHPYAAQIEKDARSNTYFRRVIYTSTYMQLVLMSLRPNEDIGLETHTATDQFFRFEHGIGLVSIDDDTYEVRDGNSIIVPAGSQHNISNTSPTQTLQFYTIYAPPHHRDGLMEATKEIANATAESFDGTTSL